MRKGKIKRHRRRARLREALYGLAIDAWDIFLGLVPVWGPVVTAGGGGGGGKKRPATISDGSEATHGPARPLSAYTTGTKPS